jgi:hypothetical protein
MIHPIYIVGDRVRMRHLAPYASNTSGTVTMVFHSAANYYDVKFDAALGQRVCYAEDMEHTPKKGNLEASFLTDDDGNRHHAPALRNRPPLLRLGIKRMVAIIAGNPAAQGKQATNDEREQATEAINILLTVLLPRLSQDEIDWRPYSEKRQFVARWLNHQNLALARSA